MQYAVSQRFQALERLVDSAADKLLDSQIASHLCRLGSVLICGNIERCLEIILIERFERKSPRQVPNFLKSYFKAGNNYNCDAILQLLNKFDNAWGAEFEAFLLSQNKIKESVVSCYAVRNSVAHGGGQSLGPQILKQYFSDSRTLVEKIEEITRS